jgi:hypothetical protein
MRAGASPSVGESSTAAVTSAVSPVSASPCHQAAADAPTDSAALTQAPRDSGNGVAAGGCSAQPATVNASTQARVVFSTDSTARAPHLQHEGSVGAAFAPQDVGG